MLNECETWINHFHATFLFQQNYPSLYVSFGSSQAGRLPRMLLYSEAWRRVVRVDGSYQSLMVAVYQNSYRLLLGDSNFWSSFGLHIYTSILKIFEVTKITGCSDCRCVIVVLCVTSCCVRCRRYSVGQEWQVRIWKDATLFYVKVLFSHSLEKKKVKLSM
jgi:hypothetical protein